MAKIPDISPVQRTRLRDIVFANMPELAALYFDIVLNRGHAARASDEAKSRIVDAFEKVLPRIPLERTDVRAETAGDIVKLIASGSVSFAEAKELMQIVQMQFEMDELRALAERLDGIDQGPTPRVVGVQ